MRIHFIARGQTIDFLMVITTFELDQSPKNLLFRTYRAVGCVLLVCCYNRLQNSQYQQMSHIRQQATSTMNKHTRLSTKDY